jgi:hypothetical protein
MFPLQIDSNDAKNCLDKVVDIGLLGGSQFLVFVRRLPPQVFKLNTNRLPGLLFGLRLQIGGYCFDLLLNSPVEFFFARLELRFPVSERSLLA